MGFVVAKILIIKLKQYYTARLVLPENKKTTKVKIEETSKPISCKMPNFRAAVKPIKDQSIGTTNKILFTLPSNKSNNPKVKIVVGQGSPNVGVPG